jgi:hypothetical protein
MKRVAAEIGESAVGEKTRLKSASEWLQHTMKMLDDGFASCDEITTQESNLHARLRRANAASRTPWFAPQNPVPVRRRYCSGSKLTSQIRNRFLTVGLFAHAIKAVQDATKSVSVFTSFFDLNRNGNDRQIVNDTASTRND